MKTYSHDEVAAEEERIGGRLPDELRQRLLDGIADELVLIGPDGWGGHFHAWGPSTTTTDTKGRPYPTTGMAKETERARDLLPEDVLVGFADDGSGDLAVVRRDGSLGWWYHDEDRVVDAEVVWEPSAEQLAAVENGEKLR